MLFGTYMTFGCSHTYNGMTLPLKHQWYSILKKRSGIDFVAYGQSGAGLLRILSNIACTCNKEEAKKVRYVVLQKPDSHRFPWWKGYDVDYHLKKMRRQSIKRGWKWLPKRGLVWQSKKKLELLSKEKTKEVADNLFQADIQMLAMFINFFPGAQLAYYHYWCDRIVNQIYRPLLADNNIKLEEVAESLGMVNLGMIVDPMSIKGVYDNKGKLVFNHKKLFDSGYIVSEKDAHPGKRHQQLVADCIRRWVDDNTE